jgi:hypothetical protein
MGQENLPKSGPKLQRKTTARSCIGQSWTSTKVSFTPVLSPSRHGHAVDWPTSASAQNCRLGFIDATALGGRMMSSPDIGGRMLD